MMENERLKSGGCMELKCHDIESLEELNTPIAVEHDENKLEHQVVCSICAMVIDTYIPQYFCGKRIKMTLKLVKIKNTRILGLFRKQKVDSIKE